MYAALLLCMIRPLHSCSRKNMPAPAPHLYECLVHSPCPPAFRTSPQTKQTAVCSDSGKSWPSSAYKSVYDVGIMAMRGRADDVSHISTAYPPRSGTHFLAVNVTSAGDGLWNFWSCPSGACPDDACMLSISMGTAPVSSCGCCSSFVSIFSLPLDGVADDGELLSNKNLQDSIGQSKTRYPCVLYRRLLMTVPDVTSLCKVDR
mmetsp:Transcript_11407/g.32733  ORF Transcript_11407/g.32733 Transcript_11407/m.32733 type:complete len:204 (-) Transcript_11407:249-860(-)